MNMNNNAILARFPSFLDAVDHANSVGVDALAVFRYNEDLDMSLIPLGNGEVLIPHPLMGLEWLLVEEKILDVRYPVQQLNKSIGE